ncbi:hypothetical protein ACNA6I_01540 [Rossellomorea sp. FS2]|uniref:hypothetical protein n=1 Tax=Rossellomorea sp. FS2 TaxID=3391447 RepID=UPI003A4D31DC
MEELLNVDFTAYLAIAVLLYAIREATQVSNRYIPVIAIALGVGFAAFEQGGFDYGVLIAGIQYALLGIGSVAAIKYQLEKRQQGGGQ